MSRIENVSLAVMLSASIAGCAMTATTNAPAAADHAGRMRGFVESSRVTDFCPDQRQRRDDERCVVTRGWDYERGVTIVRTFDPAGVIISTLEPAGADLSLTPVEQARVEALVRNDPRTAAAVNRGIGAWCKNQRIQGIEVNLAHVGNAPMSNSAIAATSPTKCTGHEIRPNVCGRYW